MDGNIMTAVEYLRELLRSLENRYANHEMGRNYIVLVEESKELG